MKAKAIRSFVDKYTKISIKLNEVIEVSEERFKELTEGPRGVFVEEVKVNKDLEEETDGVIENTVDVVEEEKTEEVKPKGKPSAKK